eukprot:gene48294-64796_t
MNSGCRGQPASAPSGQSQDADSHCKSGSGSDRFRSLSLGHCMQSATASSVGTLGAQWRLRVRTALAGVSPMSYAIAITALLVATLFVAADTIRTFDELGQRNALVKQL